ncbi:MFS transporter [Microbacterium indicum]|uniref:MFS transporter n=1 Tax=Microbacterium indicum TaxID=358100 RepID=UPI000A01EF7E|nr:MFS transporter [Microbacterium indicum]
MTRPVVRTPAFWMLFSASLLANASHSVSTPIIPVYVEDVLGGDSTTAGVIVAMTSLVSIVAMPLAGMLGDRYGYRPVAATGSIIGVTAVVLLASVPTLAAAAGARALFGLGSSAAETLVMAWAVGMTPPTQRGRTLSVYGLSVWLGIALGPQLGTRVEAAWGAVAAFWACAIIEALILMILLLMPRQATKRERPPHAHPAEVLSAGRAVSVPGLAATAAWCGQGLLLAFSLVHLASVGVPATGLLSAASVFTIFAVSVVLARLVLAPSLDRIGPRRASITSLAILGSGLVIVAITPNFWVAAIGTILIGIGFAPLYPALTMLATRRLAARNQALGLGIFAAFANAGNGLGAVVGGAMIGFMSSMWAFLTVAVLQIAAILVISCRSMR